MFDLMDYGIVFFAALTAGFINTIAGGGTLISFPVLVALGIPPVQANMTNTIALCPGYFGGVWAQIKEFKSQKKRLLTILPFSVLGGITGGLLLVNSNEKFFNILVPFLILIASLLLAFQGTLKKWLVRRTEKEKTIQSGTIVIFILLFLASVYGGYFGAGVSVIVLAILGLIYDDSLTSLNVLKQAISFCINISAAIFFAFSGKMSNSRIQVTLIPPSKNRSCDFHRNLLRSFVTRFYGRNKENIVSIFALIEIFPFSSQNIPCSGKDSSLILEMSDN